MERGAVSTLSDRAPKPVKRALAPLFFRYHSYAADREHEPREGSDARLPDAPDHVLVVVIDALRPDMVPELPLEFTTAIAPAPWTFPSVTSLHTGLRPSDHRAFAHTAPDDEEYAMPAQTDAIPRFPLELEAAGYETYAGCAFITPFLALRGWYQTHRCYNDAPAAPVLTDYLRWRRDRDRTAAYLHLGDLHAPVEPPRRYTERRDVDLSLPDLESISRYRTDFDHEDPDCRYYREQKLRLCRAALDYVTDRLRVVVDGIRDDTMIVVTGDHGEALWEHQDLDRRITDSRPNYCLGHGGTPFDAIARVPLAVSTPDGDPPTPAGGRASLRDLPATILDATVAGDDYDGQSWSDEIPAERGVVCEGTRYGVERKAVYQDDYKLIRSEADDVTLTARITDDGEEFVDLPDVVVRRLLDQLPDEWGDVGVRESVSRFTQEQLESLGYK